MSVKTYSIADGKYTLVRDDVSCGIRAYRYDEDWPAMTEDLVGNNLVNALLDYVDELEDSLEWAHEKLMDDYFKENEQQ